MGWMRVELGMGIWEIGVCRWVDMDVDVDVDVGVGDDRGCERTGWRREREGGMSTCHCLMWLVGRS